MLNWALESPMWKYLLVPQARKTMVKTAEANDIPWTSAKAWIQEQIESSPLSKQEEEILIDEQQSIPDYYRQAFHAYEDGNLSWEAACEVEIASCSVGARNFPQFGSDGENAFRGSFDGALLEAGATVPPDGIIIDLGCGTGMSTRRLATNYPQAASIIGIDLSPYFISVGRMLLDAAPVQRFQDGGPWVSTIRPDSRIHYVVGDAAKVSSASTTMPLLQEIQQGRGVDVVVLNLSYMNCHQM
jgi:SAM-dependent methyltransferase